MIKEAWDSFKDNIKERVSNPFLGTFVLVWLIHNWKVVYAFFFFDQELKMQTKIDYFNKYWRENDFFWNLICVALITIGILIITYFFLALSRYLSKIFENIIIPFINKISKGKIVTSEIHQRSLDQIELLKEKVELERKAKFDAIEERNQFEKRLTGNDIDLYKTEKGSATLTADFSKMITDAIGKFEYKSIEQALLGLDKEWGFSEDDKVIDFFLKYDLIELKKNNGYTNMIYQYKPNGRLFRRQFLDMK